MKTPFQISIRSIGIVIALICVALGCLLQASDLMVTLVRTTTLYSLVLTGYGSVFARGNVRRFCRAFYVVAGTHLILMYVLSELTLRLT